jgi:hypothetical protein
MDVGVLGDEELEQEPLRRFSWQRDGMTRGKK